MNAIPPVETMTPPSHQARYDGSAATLLGLYLVNLVLSVLTLGVYRFWGITRIRAYAWSRLSFLGARLEYTGTGLELFIGFLKAVAVLVGLYLLYLASQFLMESLEPRMLGLLGLTALAFGLFIRGVAQYGALRYRMSRTNWRGIRLRQDRAAWEYGLMYSAAFLGKVFSLGLASPALSMWLERYRTENLMIGSERFAFEGRARAVYGAFVLAWLATPILAIALPILITGIVSVSGLGDWLAAQLIWNLKVNGQSVAIPMLAGTSMPGHEAMLAVPLSLIATVLSATAILRYRARWMRYVTEHTSVQGLRFRLPVTTGGVARLEIGNWLLRVLSLGLLSALAAHRTLRFWTDHARVIGAIDDRAIAQAARGDEGAEGLGSVIGLDALTT